MDRRIAQAARLHAALRDYDGAELGFWVPFGSYIPESLAELKRMPELLSAADLGRAQREWSVIAPVLTSRTVFESTYPGVELQTIHGDAPYHNMIATADGELWSDFELVTPGAVESDLAMAGPDGVAVYNAADALGLRPLDERVLRVTEAAARLAMVAALAMAPELPMLVESVQPALKAWRDFPPVSEV